MSVPFPEPTSAVASRTQVFLTYLDYFRSVLLTKLDGLSEEQLRQSVLPSGWSPIELVNHLRCVEMRWLVWGFEGEAVPAPWLDRRDDRWYVAPETTIGQVVEKLATQAETTRLIVESHELGERGRPGDRWEDAEPATLERVLFHLVQEYARHVGHMDIVRELIDGEVGESP